MQMSSNARTGREDATRAQHHTGDNSRQRRSGGKESVIIVTLSQVDDVQQQVLVFPPITCSLLWRREAGYVALKLTTTTIALQVSLD